MIKNLCLKKDISLKKEKIERLDHTDLSKISLKNNAKNEYKPSNTKLSLFIYKKRGRKKEKTLKNVNQPEKIHDKFGDDNIKMKIRGYFHNFIVAYINMKSKKILNKNKFVKISSTITNNITIEFNQNLFEQKIKDIIINTSSKYRDRNINKNLLQILMQNIDHNDEISQILNMNYKDMYLNYYLKSNKETFKGEPSDESYEAHIQQLEKKYEQNYIINYIRNAENLIDNFYKLKKRIRKKRRNVLIKPDFSILNNCILDNNDTFFGKILVSTSTQTDTNDCENEDDDYFN